MDQGDRPVLVTGATGNTGRPIVDALTGRGMPVRAMVRQETDRDGLPAGVQVAVADFDEFRCRVPGRFRRPAGELACSG